MFADQYGILEVQGGKGDVYAPQRAMRVVANWNEVEKGAMIIEAANKNCDTAHAVVMSIW